MELTELAQNYFGDTRSGTLAGPIGGLVIGLLALVTILLIRNMNARLRRLPERFPSEAPPPSGAQPPQERTGQPAAAPTPPAPRSDPDHRTG